MEFVEKKQAYNKLLGEQHLDDDMALLKTKNPKSDLIDMPIVDKKQGQSDVLWELLDAATFTEIEQNRGVTAKAQNPKPKAQKPKAKAQKKVIKKKATIKKK